MNVYNEKVIFFKLLKNINFICHILSFFFTFSTLKLKINYNKYIMKRNFT